MATTFQSTPTWTDNVAVLGPTTVAFGGSARGTIDLRAKQGATLFYWIGRKGATAPAAAIAVETRRVVNNGTATPGGVTSVLAPFSSTTGASNATTVNADAAAGATTLGIASATGFVAGDFVCIYDSGFTRLEFARVSKVVSTTLTLDAPLLYAHSAANADAVTRAADRFTASVFPGGSLVEVVFDYGAAGSGSDVVVLCKAQTYDLDQSVQTA